jgi:flagellar FliJ protein
MARRFQFRFETLLKIRQQDEDRHKRIVAERLRQITAVRERLESLHRQIGDEEQAIREGGSPGMIDMQQIVRHRHWLGHLHKGVLESESALRALEARLAQDRAALAEAVKRRRVLDKLKERQHEHHRAAEERQEVNAADDLTTVRYVFNHAASEN